MTDLLTQTCTGVERHSLMHNSPSVSDTFQDVFVYMSKDTKILGTFKVIFIFFKIFFWFFLGGLTRPVFNLTEGQGRSLPFLIDGR